MAKFVVLLLLKRMCMRSMLKYAAKVFQIPWGDDLNENEEVF